MNFNQRRHDIIRDAARLLDRQVIDYMHDVQHGHAELHEFYNASTPVEIQTLREYFRESELVQALRSIGITVVRRNDFNYELTLEKRYVCARRVTRRVAVMGDAEPMYLMRAEDPVPIEFEERLLEELHPLDMPDILRSVPPPDPRATPYDYMREQERAYQREVEHMTAIPPRFVADRMNLRPGGVTHMEEEKKQPLGATPSHTANGEPVLIPCYEEELPLTSEDLADIADALTFDEG